MIRTLLLLTVLVTLVVGISGCGGQPTAAPAASRVELAPESVLAPRVAAQPPLVREAYRFAVANPDVLAQLPCYCGCGNMGHTSNRDCFIQQINPDGSVIFGDHALG